MPIRKTLGGIVIEAKVKTGCSSFSAHKSGDDVAIEVSSPPLEGRANKEIIKELRKMFRAQSVEIVKGLKSKNKTVFIKGDPGELQAIIDKLFSSS